MSIVTQRIFKFYLAVALMCEAQASWEQENWTPENVLRWPVTDETLNLSHFLQNLQSIPESEHSEWIHEALEAGFMPGFLRQLKQVHSRHGGHELTFWVTPDYLAIGDDESYLHVPISGSDALSLAANWNMYLPTRKMVDLIYQQAGVRLPSVWLDMDQIQDPIRLWLDHEERLDPDLQKYAVSSGWLQAGHKKDLVMTPRLIGRPDRAAIYGWQGTDDRLLQNLATSISTEYSDYSMGLRLVAPFCLVDGHWMPLAEVLSSPELAPLLSDEGAWDVNELLRLDPLPVPPARQLPANLLVQHYP